VLHEFLKCYDLRSIRDKHFNEINTELGAWLAENETPEWLSEILKNLPTWRSQGRLVTLVLRWCDERFHGDTEIYQKLEHWRKRENHLYDWEANLRDQVHRRRREIYRIFAAEIIRRHDTVILEDFDLRRIAKKMDAESGTSGSLPMDRQRFIAAVSELRLALKNACLQAGAEVLAVDAKNSTVECHECGHLEKFDASNKVWQTCSKCGKLWDQDYNAAINLLNRGFEVRR
jgi:transposase